MVIIRQPVFTLRQFTHKARLINRTMASNSVQNQQGSPDLTEKLSAVKGFLDKRKSVMLVTRAPNGSLHSRCMAVAEITPDWKFRFLYDKDHYWDKEMINE